VRTVVFLGPSLPRQAAIAILPGAVYLPPARQADVVSAVETYRPDVIALIDGSFGQSLSVWHKEILFAIDRGVSVYGAASLGALRAAELASFGMQGIGEVYRLFASGELQDDDEVALVHASAAENFRPMSEPMVNLRATFTLARDIGALTSDECALLIATAKQRYFPDRRWPEILTAAAAQGVSAATAERLTAFIVDNYVDLKRRDAVLVLELIRDLPDPLPPAVPPGFTLERTASFDTLYENERSVRQDGVDVPLRSIAAYAALHDPAFDDLNFAALNRALVLVLADMLHVTPAPSEIEAEIARFCLRRGLQADSTLADWRAGHHLSAESFEALIRELATARRLQRWLLARDRGTRRTRWLLDELRLRGAYPAAASAAAEQHALAESWGLDFQTEDELELGPLVAAHQQATDWRLDAPLATWATDAGFDSAQDLALELLLAAQVRERLRAAARALAGARPS
jgi:hypothetical protein